MVGLTFILLSFYFTHFKSFIFDLFLDLGEVLGALCKKVGPEIYGNVKDQILHGIRSNLERDMPTGEGEHDHDDVSNLVQKLSTSPGSIERVSLMYKTEHTCTEI